MSDTERPWTLWDDEFRAVAALLRSVASRRAATPLGLALIPGALAVADAVLGAATPDGEQR